MLKMYDYFNANNLITSYVATFLSQSFLEEHPVKLIPELCRQFYTLGWVTGTGGGISIKSG